MTNTGEPKNIYDVGDIVKLKDAEGRFQTEKVDVSPMYKLKVIDFESTGRGFQKVAPHWVPHSAIKRKS